MKWLQLIEEHDSSCFSTGEGDVLPLHTAVSVQVINWCPMFGLCHEANRGSNYHRWSLVNNNERIPFVFMDSSVFDHLPLSSEVSSCQGHIMGSAGHAESSALLQLFCTHGQVTLAMKRSWLVTSLLWKDLLQSSCPTTPVAQRRNVAALPLAPPWIPRIQIRSKPKKWGCCLS